MGLPEILLVPHRKLLGGKIFGLEGGQRATETSKPWQVLREQLLAMDFDLKTIDQSSNPESAHAVVFFEMPGRNNQYYRFCLDKRLDERMYLMVFEPHVVHPPGHEPSLHSHFKRILTWNDDLVDNRRYFKMNYTIPLRFGEKVKIPRFPFERKKLLCLIFSNKYSSHPKEIYSERVRAIRFMEKNHPADFDLYGVGWDLPIIHSRFASELMLNVAISKFWPKLPKFMRFRSYPSYRGTVEYKSEVLPKYKFTIAYENMLDGHGYITEKILESFLYGCIPIYLGDPNISKLIPESCFIDKRRYPTYESLYQRLSEMGEGEHTTYLNNIEKFLNSKTVYPFTIDSFIQSFRAMLEI